MDLSTCAANLSEIPAKYMYWILVAILWQLPWKGVALWKSARNKQAVWFIVLLVVNTLALLEILYLAFFQKKAKPVEKPARPVKRKRK